MRKLPTFPHLATTVAVIGLAALFGPASGSQGYGRIVLKAPVLASADGEAEVQPVDLDGDGFDDSPAFAAALAAEEDAIRAENNLVPIPRAKPQVNQVVVLHVKHLPCTEVAAQQLSADLDAPLQRISEKTPWVLLAASDDAPNAKGKELRVLGQPVLAKASNKLLVIEPDDGAVPESTIPVSTLPKGCVAEPTVS